MELRTEVLQPVQVRWEPVEVQPEHQLQPLEVVDLPDLQVLQDHDPEVHLDQVQADPDEEAN